MNSKNIKLFSFFSGAGFLDLGFEHSGFNVAFANEIYAPFLEAYCYSRQILGIPEPEYGYFEDDIINLTEGNRKEHLQVLVKQTRQTSDLIGFIAGPPCPDFSVGGKNRGKNGDQGKLTACYIELICQQRPDFFIFENVKGLWSTKKHRMFYEEMKRKLMSNNYCLTERLINAIEYGVPQDRDRLILIGFQESLLNNIGFDSCYSSVIPDGLFPWKQHIIYPRDQVFSYSWPKLDSFVENSVLEYPPGIPEELTVEYWFRKNHVVGHPNAEHYFKPRAGLPKFTVIPEGDDCKKSYKRLHRWRYSPTACYGNNEVHLHPYKIRRISAAEALAIQSLPKEFVLPSKMSLSSMFKTIGNGVPYLAAKGIAETILDFLSQQYLTYKVPMIHQLELPLVYSSSERYKI
ncbi:DNA cytosine methyltransferase [Planktothrix agardhii 1033]|jgi:DNA (cytosine-5)-methyltransferase 1|nr:DNA cytosine methyltransferase [Planktothrix agardhii 1033]